MGDVTRNLSRHEYSCKCGCGLNDMHPMVVAGVQDMADRAPGSRVTVTSGCRCEDWNRHEGGAEGSPHLRDHAQRGHDYCTAMDIILVGVPLIVAYGHALSVPQFYGGGIGVYPGDPNDPLHDPPRLHVDVRGHRARWGFINGVYVPLADALRVLDERAGR